MCFTALGNKSSFTIILSYMTKWEIHPSVLLKAHSVLHMPISASEGCYNAGKLPARLREGHHLYNNLKVTKAYWSITYLSSQSNALLRLSIIVSIKINANFSVASKNLSVTLWKAENDSVYSTPFKPSRSQAKWELTSKRRSESKKWTDRFTQDWLGGVHRWSRYLGD